MRAKSYWPTFIIRYVGKRGTDCWDIQRGAHLLDAMCAHFRAFPHSTPRTTSVEVLDQ